MTTRERHLAVTLVAVLGTGALGFISYQFVLSPLLDKNRQIAQKKREIEQLEEDILDIQLKKRQFEAARQQSLPADVGRSREQYGNLLEKLCHRADLRELKILQAEPDNKSVPMIAPRKPAYTRLTYKVAAKGEVYHLVDFLRQFYHQPLLHAVKAMNIQRPSESRARDRRELDIDLTIEALVLDGAPDRGTLLPIVRELALLTGPAAQAGMNVQAVATGKGSPVPPAGVLSDSAREYLAIAGKDVFFGPPRKKEERDKSEEDLSKYIVLTSVVGYEDGTIRAVFRDKSTNNDYTVTQSPRGAIAVKGEYELTPGRRKLLPGYSEARPGQVLFYGSAETANLRAWRVRRVTFGEVILEKLDAPGSDEKPRPPAMALAGGGAGVVVAVPEGKVYSVAVGHCLDPESRLDSKPPGSPPPTRLLTRDAWRAIYTPAPPPVATVSTEDRGR